jgi:hypothetical protein
MFEYVVDPEVIYFSDRRVWEWYGAGIAGTKARIITVAKGMKDERVEYWLARRPKGLSTEPKCLSTGNNSGYAAINLAYHLGAKVIVLLGLDMKLSAERCHVHSPHPALFLQRYIDNMLPMFDSLVEPLAAAGVAVVNAGPDSAIECFPKLRIDSIITELDSGQGITITPQS